MFSSNTNDAFPVIVRYEYISRQMTTLHPVWDTVDVLCAAGSVLDFWSVLVVLITYDGVSFVRPLMMFAFRHTISSFRIVW